MAWVVIANLKGAPGDAAALGRFEDIDDALAALNVRSDVLDGRVDVIEATGVTSTNIPGDRVEFADELGQPFLAVESLSNNPYLKGSPTPILEPASSDSFEMVDELGNIVFAIDSLSNGPHLRGGSGGGGSSFTETHFVVLVGQSNSVGFGPPIPQGTNNPLPNLFTIPQRGTNIGSQQVATDPLTHPYADPSAGTAGHGWEVARDYALANPGIRVVILPMAMAGSGFFYSSQANYTWAPSRVGEAGMTNLYTEAISRCNAAIAMYAAPKRVAMFLWHQGEADAVGNTTQSQYEAELKLLIDGLRTNISGGASAPFIIGQLGWEFRNVRQPGTWAQIDAAHQAIPAQVLGTAFAPAPGQGYMLPDNTHFTGHGQKLLAQSIISVIQDAHYNI